MNGEHEGKKRCNESACTQMISAINKKPIFESERSYFGCILFAFLCAFTINIVHRVFVWSVYDFFFVVHRWRAHCHNKIYAHINFIKEFPLIFCRWDFFSWKMCWLCASVSVCVFMCAVPCVGKYSSVNLLTLKFRQLFWRFRCVLIIFYFGFAI